MAEFAQYIIAGLAALVLLVGVMLPPAVGSRYRWLVSTRLILILAVVAGVNYFCSRSGAWLHRWDLFHTTTSVRFFDELGYDGLYECALSVGSDQIGPYENVTRVRDLRSREVVDAAHLLQPDPCEDQFTPQREAAFVRDLRFWRGVMPPERWRQLFRDKGYNGTPYVTLVGSALFSWGDLSLPRLWLTSLIDALLILVAFAFVAKSFGLRVASVAFIFFCVSYPNRFVHMGGSALRFSYVAYLMVAAAMLKEKRFAAAGVLIALAGMERIFPFLFAAAMFIKAGADSIGERRVSRDGLRFLYGFSGTVAIAFAVTVLFYGVEPWVAFLRNLEIHSAFSAGFRVGLRHLFAASGNVFGADGFVPHEAKEVLFRGRLIAFLIVVAALFTPLMLRVRRLSTLSFVVVFGLLAFFAFAYATRYYYSVVVLLFLVSVPGRERLTRVSWMLLFAMTAIMYGVGAFNDFNPFLYNILLSTLLLVYFVFLLAALWVATRSSPAPLGVPQRYRQVGVIAGASLLIVLSAAATLWTVRSLRGPELGVAASVPARLLEAPERVDAVARLVAAVRDDDAVMIARGMERLDDACLGLYAALRDDGQLVASVWVDSALLGEAIVDALDRMGVVAGGSRGDVLELYVVRSRLPFRLRDVDVKEAELHRGLRGIEFRYDDVIVRLSPTELIAGNVDVMAALNLSRKALGLVEGADAARFVSASFTEGEQLLVALRGSRQAHLMHRGNTVVAIVDVTSEAVALSAQMMGQWLINNVTDDGALTYKVYPGRAQASDANNMIRQWMGTIALTRYALAENDSTALVLAERNIGYNLRQYYREENGLGVIEWQGKVKLGAVALAALALLEHPAGSQYVDEQRALWRTIQHLRQDDGAFHTFLRPSHRHDNQNFYPGEALLLMASVYEREPTAQLRDQIMTSFHYYREWHMQNRNPAFVPWHTQAYAIMWRQTRDPQLAAFILEMNDWLLGVQQWQDARYPDHVGRFFDPDRAHFGPPHASSTGVYLEGLIDAWRVAVDLGDVTRQHAYARAIVGGIRSAMQLQFVDDVDLYYVMDRRQVVGGLRTTVHNNIIRVDNVQHNLMALLTIMAVLPLQSYVAD